MATDRIRFHKIQKQNNTYLLEPKNWERRENTMERTLPKIMALLVSTVLILSMLAMLRPGIGSATELPDYEAIDWQTSQAGFEEELLTEGFSSTTSVESFATTPPVGTSVWDWYLWAISRNDPGGPGQKAWMTLKAQVGNVEVWVQNDMSFPEGDPRNDYPRNWTLTDEMTDYIADMFDSVIYARDTTYFGMPYDRDGSGNVFIGSSYPTSPPEWWTWIEAPDNPQRVILKILNIRDTNYYNPGYPYYTAGFYSSTYTRTYYKRNMIHIDCWQWWRRVGPEGYHWYPDTTVPPERANLYESVVAHEFQHNIHRDWIPNDDTFMNEGCSEYAQILCGWPHTLWGHINSFLYTPDNSLILWGDQGDINILADYGAAALWVMYISDQYGGAATISHYMQAGIPGIAGINAALEYFGYTERFDDVFHDWRIANLIHSDAVSGGRYNYETLDLGGPDATPAFTHTISGLPVPLTMGSDFGTTKTNLGYDTGVILLAKYSSDYIVMNDWNKKGKVYFDGDDIIVYGWTMDSGVWWSGRQNMLDALLYGEAYVDPSNPTLDLVTRYDIENLWDYGFVQVSTDGGATWVSQSNAYTTYDHDPGAIAPIVANLPGLTGESPGWPDDLMMEFDLTAYAGQTLLVGFRYMTDPNTLGAGWYISDAQVSGTSLTLTPLYPLAEFQVSLVRHYLSGSGPEYIVNDIDLETGNTGAKGVNVLQPDYVILVVSSLSTGLVDYAFEAKTVPIKGDVNADGVVNLIDAALISAHWSGPPTGPLGYDRNYDINYDGVVGVLDAAMVSADWGKRW